MWRPDPMNTLSAATGGADTRHDGKQIGGKPQRFRLSASHPRPIPFQPEFTSGIRR